MRPDASVAALLASPTSFPLFVEAPSRAPSTLSSSAGAITGWVLSEDTGLAPSEQSSSTVIRLFPAEGVCECAYDVRPTDDGQFSAPAPASHGPKKLPRTIHLAPDRSL